jgi:hypothetical protein
VAGMSRGILEEDEDGANEQRHAEEWKFGTKLVLCITY